MDNPQPVQNNTRGQNIFLPIAILLASIILGGSLVASALIKDKSPSEFAAPVQAAKQEEVKVKSIRQVTPEDHIRGNPNAIVKIVEYSDTECPFCKSFHPTMKQVFEEYGKTNQVAWVYRHFPLDQIHPKARKEAEATECAAELGGNDAFWKYIDRIYEITPANNRLDLAELPKIAKFVGLDVNKFNQCLESGKYAQRVENDSKDAIASGARGTPWTIVVSPKGTLYPVNGAQPYNAVKTLIETALKDK
ncbi:MAG: thioredoxin domain-containing protein [Patescibacteria group bacterium]